MIAFGKRYWLVILALLVFAVPSLQATALTFSTFTSPNGTSGSSAPIGFAYAGNKFVGSLYYNGGPNTILYSTDLNGGNVQPFGTSVGIPGGTVEEHYVSSSIGLGGFPNRDVYVGVNGAIYRIANDGSSGGVFVSGLLGDVRGITFDAIGSFGNDMLVTTSSGLVYRVKSDGTYSTLANVGSDSEGLDVAPYGAAGPYSGYLFIASESFGGGSVRAINPITGVVSGILASISAAEELDFVPLNLGASGNPVEGFYAANFSVDVQKAGASQFAGLQGDILVTSEFGSNAPVWAMHWNGSSFDVSQIGALPNQAEDGLFVTEAVIRGAPEPSTLLLFGSGIAGLIALRRRRH